MIEKFLLSYPAEFNDICLVYPPKIKEIVATTDYSVYVKILTITQEDIEDEYTENKLSMDYILNPFEYILNYSYNNEDVAKKIKDAFYFFIHENITILYNQKKIVIGDIAEVKNFDELRIIDEQNYFDFQNIVRAAIGMNSAERPEADLNSKIKAMKAKARYRDRIKAKKNKGINLETTLTAICCMGIGINPLNIGELSYVAVQNLFSMYQNKEKYELDINSLLAGADSKKVKPVYWIKNLDD